MANGALDLSGFRDIGSGGGVTCDRCYAYVWKGLEFLDGHRAWHDYLDDELAKAADSPSTEEMAQRLLGGMG